MSKWKSQFEYECVQKMSFEHTQHQDGSLGMRNSIKKATTRSDSIASLDNGEL